MKTRQVLAGIVALGLLPTLVLGLSWAQEPGAQAALGTAFTYQGQLKSGDEPLNGACDLQFSLWDAASGGTQIGTTQTRANVAVSNGLFTIPDLDFGSSAFAGDARWLAIGVRCPAGSGAYTPLAPRQALTAAPYALFSKAAPWSGLSGVPAGFADGVDNDTTYTAGVGLTLTGNQFSLNTGYTDGRYWRLAGNSGTNPTTHFLGTTDNQALELRVNNARALRLEPNATSPNLIGGYSGNSVTSGAFGATVAGGGASALTNRVTDNYGTVGGGRNNQAGDQAGSTSDKPYATVGGGGSNTASGLAAIIGGGYGNSASGDYASIAGGYVNAATGAGAAIGGGYSNSASGNDATISGGYSNSAGGNDAAIGGGEDNVASGESATVSGGWSNTASHDYAAVGGGAGNTASGPASTVSGGRSNLASGESASVGGGDYNVAAAAYATIAGGGPSDPNDPGNTNNRVTDDYGAIGGGGGNRAGDGDGDPTDARYATVGGGYSNAASGLYATVGGGWGNTASGEYATVSGGAVNTARGHTATVGGGQTNTASGQEATVGGGWYNTASGWYATVGGGRDNTASGHDATVPGGADNVAQGDYSFAAGRRAKAYNQGCFVLADATDADEPCVNDNRFVFRVTNAFYIWTTANHTAGVLLPTGGNAWSSVSDRAAKENFSPVDGRDVLNRLAAIPIQTWNYRSQDPAIRHIGPVAQDFYAAFGVGEDDTHISTVDADGVALAAIQGLDSLSKEQAARIDELEAENTLLRERLDSLEARMEALERGSSASGGGQPLGQILPGAGLLLATCLVWAAQRKAGQL